MPQIVSLGLANIVYTWHTVCFPLVPDAGARNTFPKDKDRVALSASLFLNPAGVRRRPRWGWETRSRSSKGYS